MTRSARFALLVALGAGVFLAGLELMITATALPTIVADIADWTRLRQASWIVNGYLVAYVAMMPLAGRLADRYGIVRPFLLALVTFGAGSALSGAAQSLEPLVAARVLEGLGGGALIPLATAAASHLYEGPARGRALGVIGALTFLGMAAGPFVGSAILSVGDMGPALTAAGLPRSATSLLAPAWRWVFYVDVPLAALVLVYVWAAAGDWDTPRVQSPLRLPALGLFTVGLAGALIAMTWAGAPDAPGGTAGWTVAVIGSTVAIVAALVIGARTRDPLLDPHRYAERVLGGAVAVSGLTGYALATALIGGAVFVDRVLYGGPAEQRVALGALAAAIAVGALVSGLVLSRVGVVSVTLVGIACSVAALVMLGRATALTPLDTFALLLAVYGLGFGLTVSPRSMAAVEAAGREAYGVASAAVTVARMLGMSVGLAILTAFGSERIESLSRAVQDQAFRDSVLPAALRGRPLNDGLVVDALEKWAANQGAGILAGLFLVAAAVTAVAIFPAVAMGGERRAAMDVGAEAGTGRVAAATKASGSEAGADGSGP